MLSMLASTPTLTLLNVALALLFILLDALLSLLLGLGISSLLLVAAARCVIQLSVMALVLDSVFQSQNPWAVAGIVVLLNGLGAVEAVYNKSKRRFANMFPLVLLAMMSATIPISVLGTRYAMAQEPFWQPDQFVPIIGMILGNAISSIGIAMNYVQKEFAENKDKIETYLAMGASRTEACRPLAVEALRMAMLPVVNQMSVIGLISIPGMMTGAIIGGKSVEQAARLQMIIMFMISASSALATLLTLLFALSTLMDGSHRIRLDRMDSRPAAFYRWRDGMAKRVWAGVGRMAGRVGCGGRGKGKGKGGGEGEREGLLSAQEGRD